MHNFVLHSDFQPTGDQPEAIEKLTEGIEDGLREQVLLGVTGSGKTFTMANIIAKLNRPTLVLAHNKTLAGQLYSEFKEFFPDNCVEYFVSYYDYYQPEAYIPISDTYIEKDSSVNEEIDRLRHSATAALFERRDVIIVASVSCIYGLGDPEDYVDLMLSLRPGMNVSIQSIAMRLVQMHYTHDKSDFSSINAFKIAGDTLLIKPAGYKDTVMKISFFGDEIEKITQLRAIDYKVVGTLSHLAVFPASHYSTTDAKMERAISSILAEMEERVKELKDNNKMLEAYRLEQRTRYDMEMLKETKFCSGIENYSRHISGRKPGSAPYTLLDYFPKDFIMFIDESHTTVPQVRAMYNGDRARKEALVEYGFRLPSAFDNRPLKFDEFCDKINQVIYVSATPAPYELNLASQVVEQIIRPTGLIDPVIEVRPVDGQIDDLLDEIKKTAEKNERVLVTTLTKKMAEDLTEYFTNIGIKVTYLHSDIKALERMKIIKDLRTGEFDVLIGINLLREGLDIPEVSLIAILDADKTGFLRSETALVQTIGRAARNINGKVIMYADNITEAMASAIGETNRRREIQIEYNRKNNIVPKSVHKDVRAIIETVHKDESDMRETETDAAFKAGVVLSDTEAQMDIYSLIDTLTDKMARLAAELKYEEAAVVRDAIMKLKKEIM